MSSAAEHSAIFVIAVDRLPRELADDDDWRLSLILAQPSLQATFNHACSRGIGCPAPSSQAATFALPEPCNSFHYGCHYCYARATHPYLGLDADEDFATRIIVKSNMPEVLRRELGRRSWTRERVAIGTATDAYQPCEGRYRLTRRCLEALRDSATPVSIVTKSTLILRDLDLLTELSQGPGAAVYFTITTLDDAVWRLIEPGTPPPIKRLEVLRLLTNEGVRCGVFLAPILPGITDAPESIEAVAGAAKAHGAVSFGSAVLRLAPQVKEHYLALISEIFPDLLPRYERAYAGTTMGSEYQAAIGRRLARVRERHGFLKDAMQSGSVEATSSMRAAAPESAGPGQLTLPLSDQAPPA